MLKKASRSDSRRSHWTILTVVFLAFLLCVSFSFNADTDEAFLTNSQNRYTPNLDQGDNLQFDLDGISIQSPRRRSNNRENTGIAPYTGLRRPVLHPTAQDKKFSGDIKEVKRGERPYVDHAAAPKDAYEAGRIKIKLAPATRSKNLDRIIIAGSDGYVITGIPELDNLNMLFSVQQYENTFHRIYDISPVSLQYKARHEAWGFDLWFELDLGKNADVIEAVYNFEMLSSVEIATPIYKKVRILPESDAIIKNESYSENDSKFTPNDTYYASYQWHFNNTGQTIQGQAGTPGCDVSAEDAWDIETGLSDVVVSIHDGGIQYNHPDISANMWPGIGPDGTSTTPDDHGTHTAGTVAAVTNNSTGVAGLAGGSGSGDGVRLMSIDIFDGSLSFGYVWAADNGSAISSNSWGYSPVGAYDPQCLDEIDYFNLYGGGDEMDGGLVVFAAGNDGQTGNWYPGCYSGTLAVAGTDNQDKRYDLSSIGYGATNYGAWVDISAPGVWVTSTVINNYSQYVGTSMACPHVSGAAALVVSYAIRNGFMLTREQVWNILTDTADDHYGVNPGWEGLLGSGRLNAHEALLKTQVIMGDLPPYNMSLRNISGNYYIPAEYTFYYQFRLRNMGSLSDGFFLELTPEWGEGLFMDDDGTDTPVPSPLVLGSMEEVIIYLKVTPPAGTPYWTMATELVEAYGTGTYDYATAVSVVPNETIFFEDFETCPAPGWQVVRTGGNSEWSCHVQGGIPCMRHPQGSGGNTIVSYLISPQISLPSSGYFAELWFYHNRTIASTNGTRKVMISTTTDDIGSFSDLTANLTPGQNQWSLVDVDLSAYAGQDIYLAFYCSSANRESDWLVTYVGIDLIQKRSLPYYEPFNPGIPLYDWSVYDGSTEGIWWISPTRVAGGQPNELMAEWVESYNGETYMVTPPIDVDGIGQVALSFRHRYSDYEAGITMKVQYSTNLSTWNDIYTITSGSGNQGPEQMYFLITGLVFADTLYIRWHTNGNHYQFNNWYIDDILVDLPVNYSYLFTNQSGNLLVEEDSTVYYRLRVRNTGTQSDNYTFSTTLSSWGEGLYMDNDGTDTPVPVPLTIAGYNYADVFLKVVVPPGASAGQSEEDTVQITGTPGSESITVTTTAIELVYEEWFEGCSGHNWVEYRLQDTAGNHWGCTAATGYGYFLHNYTTSAQYADNWMVSPLISMPTGAKGGNIWLYFYEAWAYAPWYDYHGIWVSRGSRDPNDGDYEEFIEIPAGAFGEEGSFHGLMADFTEYGGGDIYIAFRYMGADATLWAFTGVMILDEGYAGPVPEYLARVRARHVEGVTITPLPGMNVWIWDEDNPSVILLDADTDSLGLAGLDLPAGNYGFDVWDYYQRYDYYVGSFTVSNASITTNANLNKTNYTVTWEIIDMAGLPIEGAVIDIDGVANPPATGSDGKTSTTLTFGTYTYSVAESCYETINASVDIAMFKDAVSREDGGAKASTYHLLHQMTEADCKVIFNARDGSEPVMGVKIYIDGSPYPLITDSTGYAETYLTCGNYGLTAEAGSYKPYYGSFSVEGSDEKNIIEIELDYDPVYIKPAVSIEHPSYTGIWLWEYDGAKPSDISAKGSNWTNILQGITAKKILAGDITNNGEIELIALLEGQGLWFYSIQNNTWTVIIPDPGICIDFTLARTSSEGPLQIVSSLKDHGIYIRDHTQGNIWPSSWQRIISATADILIADNITRNTNGIHELAIAFRDFEGLYFYSFETNTFSRITTVSPSQITKADIDDNGFNELILVFDGYGVYLARYEPSASKNKTDIKYELFDIIGDIPHTHEWTSKGGGLEFTRITWGTPDAGHQVGTGDIKLGFGEEIFITYSGYTYYYSADSGAWSVFAFAPMKRLTHGRFTGYVKGDLIVCDTNTGNIYLYRTKTHSWELLVHGGYANAMAPLE